MYAFNNAPRCGAKAKINNGDPCRCPAIKGKSRCRLHGGASSGAPRGNSNAIKHGFTAAEAQAFRKSVRQTIKLHRTLLRSVAGLLTG